MRIASAGAGYVTPVVAHNVWKMGVATHGSGSVVGPAIAALWTTAGGAERAARRFQTRRQGTFTVQTGWLPTR